MTDQSDLRAMAEYHSNISPKNKKLLRVLADYIEDGEPGLVEPTAHTAVIVHVAPRWVPVGEDLPAVGQLCLVAALDDYDLAVYIVDGNNQFWHGWRFSYPLDVTHWQPLPDLPEVNR